MASYKSNNTALSQMQLLSFSWNLSDYKRMAKTGQILSVRQSFFSKFPQCENLTVMLNAIQQSACLLYMLARIFTFSFEILLTLAQIWMISLLFHNSGSPPQTSFPYRRLGAVVRWDTCCRPTNGRSLAPLPDPLCLPAVYTVRDCLCVCAAGLRVGPTARVPPVPLRRPGPVRRRRSLCDHRLE